MPRPRINADDAPDQRGLQRIEGMLEAVFLGDEVVELLADDCGCHEDLVDGR